MFKPSVVAYDFETSGLKYWEPGFRVLSCAFAWRDINGDLKTRYLDGEDEVASQLAIIASDNIPLVAHNLQFEWGVTSYRFPSFPKDLLAFDTARLVQMFDNGGRDGLKDGPMTLEDELAMLNGELKVKSGLSLESSVSRLLPKHYHNHKAPYYQWLRDNANVKKGTEGANLHLLPEDMFAAYNEADAVVTLLLFEKITTEFGDFDWRFDHSLHRQAIARITAAKAHGIRVDTEKMANTIEAVSTETETIEQRFLDHHQSLIKDITTDRYLAWVDEPITERGKAARRAKLAPEGIEFNPKSATQLTELFVNRMGIKPTFWTKESKASKKKRDENPSLAPYQPKPSFKAAHLASYGPGGEMLSSYKKRLLVLNQCNKLNELSGDGRWHLDLRACGTKTGRYVGGGGLNAQGLARKDPGLMECLIADPGWSFVSIDLAAGEPTCVAHYSQDENYRAFTFDLVGKPVTWKGDLLWLDDPYLAFASISPLAEAEIRQAWNDGIFEGWLADAEAVKKTLKRWRAIHKTFFLALMYGQGPRGMVNFSADQGFYLEHKIAKELHYRFWNVLFPNVRQLGSRLELQFRRDKHLVNEFGYRLVPEAERFCLNSMIQSTVSGIMKTYENALFQLAPQARYVTTIHDEVILATPTEALEETKQAALNATHVLNENLGWSVDIRTGWAPGKSLYEAK